MSVTARVYPFYEDGPFMSGVAEAAFDVAKKFGLNRGQLQEILQAFAAADDKSKWEYEQWRSKREREYPSPVPSSEGA